MIPPTVIPHPSNHFSERLGAPISAIVLHHTAGTDSLAYLTKNAAQVSTHVLIPGLPKAAQGGGGGLIYRMVADNKAAHTVGFSNLGYYVTVSKAAWWKKKGSANQVTLNIEFENLGNGIDPYEDLQLHAGAWQVAQWWNQYGELPIIGHGLIDTGGKNDPYRFPYLRFLRMCLAWYDT